MIDGTEKPKIPSKGGGGGEARVQGGAYSRILRNKVFPVFAKPVNDN